MSVQTCVGCSTRYAEGLDACPHCGGTEYEQEGAVVSTRRLPLLVSVSCEGCGRGPWQLRLPVVVTGLVQIPELHCASCGSQVQIPWPPVEEDMPKITRRGNDSVATNAREAADPSPDAPASQPLAGAEAGQGRPTSLEAPVVEEQEAVPGEALPEAPADAYAEDAVALAEPEVDPYAGMTLAELREAADARGVASYGTKAQITERLQAADEDAKTDAAEE